MNVVAYIEQYVPDFRRRIRGSTSDEIDTLEDAAGHQLPSEYRDFLATMGSDDDRLLSKQDIWTDPPHLLSFYRELVACGESSVPDDCVVIATSGVAIEQLYLEREGLGRVFEGGDGQKNSLWAESLESLLWQLAYMRYRQRSLPYVHEYTSAGKASVSESVREIVRSAGLIETEFSGGAALCAEFAGTTLAFRQIAGAPAWVRVAGVNGAGVIDVSRQLVEKSRGALRRLA